MGPHHPLSPRVLLATLLVTIIGGVIVAMIAGEGRFAPSASQQPGGTSTEAVESEPDEGSDSSEQVNEEEACLATPKLLSPLNGTRVASLIPILRWKQLALVPSRIEISSDRDFGDIAQTQSDKTSDPQVMEFMPTSNLQPAKLYYWRVTFLCGDWSSPDVRMGGSAVGSFRTGSAGQILPAPITIEPRDGSIIDKNTVVFRWSPVRGAKGYLLSTGSYGGFLPENTNSTDTYYESAVADKQGTWSVAAFNDYAISPFSTPIAYTRSGTLSAQDHQ